MEQFQTGINKLVEVYPINSPQYKIIYAALNWMAHDLDNAPDLAQGMAHQLGLTEDTLHAVLEELYTFNPDPDNAE